MAVPIFAEGKYHWESLHNYIHNFYKWFIHKQANQFRYTSKSYAAQFTSHDKKTSKKHLDEKHEKKNNKN